MRKDNMLGIPSRLNGKANPEWHKAWHKAYPEKSREWKALGLDLNKANLIYNSSNECAICKIKVFDSKKCLDHNHETLEIRGVLCHKCNLALGIFSDSIPVLQNAISYLGGSKPF